MLVTAGIRKQLLSTTYRRPPEFPHWTVGILIHGAVRLSAGGHHATVRAPFVSVVPPNRPYSLRFAGKGTLWVNGWAILSPPPHWHRWFDLPEVLSPLRGCRLPSSKEGRLVISTLKEGLKTLRHSRGEQEALLENMLEKMLILIHLARPDAGVVRPDARVMAAMNLIQTRYAQSWTVDRLAKEVHLSASRFSHLFCQGAGKGPMRYLEEHRVEQAKALLLSTNMAVGAVAVEVGYENPYHFSTRFRAVTGQSPRAFRLKPQPREAKKCTGSKKLLPVAQFDRLL